MSLVDGKWGTGVRSGANKAKDLWYAIGTLNFVGALAVIVGARTEHILYLAGVVLMLPGSVLSSLFINSWEHQTFNIHWNCCGTNSASIIDLLYLPLALLLNLLLTALIVWLLGRRKIRDSNRDPVGLRQH